MAGSLTTDKIKNVFQKIVFLVGGKLYTTKSDNTADEEVTTIDNNISFGGTLTGASFDAKEDNITRTDLTNVTSSTTVASATAVKAAYDRAWEPIKGADDNYVTDAEKTLLGNTSGTNTGDATYGKNSGNSLKSEEAIATDEFLLMGTSHVKGLNASDAKSALGLSNAVTYDSLPIIGGTLTGFLELHSDPVSNMQAATKQYVDNNSTSTVITTQESAPTSISEFDTSPFIYSGNYLYHKIDSSSMAKHYRNQVTSFAFSQNDPIFTTTEGGSSEFSDTTVVGSDSKVLWAKLSFENHDGTLDSAPLLTYKINTTTFVSPSTTPNSSSHMSSDDFTSNTAVAVAATTSSTDTSDDSGMVRNVAEGEYITVTATVTEDGTSYTETSSRYYFINKIIWGTCAATTGPTQAEFTAAMEGAASASPGSFLLKSGTQNSIIGGGSTLQTITGYGTAFSKSEYHSLCPDLTITGASGKYTFFGWPKNGGVDNEASTIKQADNASIHPDDVATDLRAIQTVTGLHNAAVDSSNGYTQDYNVYVSVNQAVTFTGIQIT